MPVSVRFEERDGIESWRRTFAGQSFSSTQAEGCGRWQGLIVERFGPVAVGFALRLDGDKLRLVIRRWSAFGLPLPPALAPGGDIYESAPDGRFRFHVEIRHPFTGLIVRYKGWLEPEE